MKYLSRARHEIFLGVSTFAFGNLFSNIISNICPPGPFSSHFFAAISSAINRFSSFLFLLIPSSVIPATFV